MTVEPHPRDGAWRTIAFVIFGASVLSSSLRMAFESPRRDVDGEQVRVAASLATTGSFADPFAVLATGPTAHVPPIFPAVMAAAMRLFGSGFSFEAALGVLVVLSLGLQCALLPSLSRLLFGDAAPGLYAAAAAVLLPMWDLVLDWDALHVACAVVAFCTASLARLTEGENPAGAAVVLGLGLGLMLLLNPGVVGVVAPWLVYVHFRRRARALRHGGLLMLVVVAAAGAVCLPWVLRTHSRLGGWVFIRDNLGLELHTSNNACAAASLEQNLQSGCHYRTHPNKGIDEARRLASRGEIAYNRERLRDALSWISSHPRRFARLTAERFALFWFPPPLYTRRVAWSVWLVTAASMPGFILLFRQRRAESLTLVAAALCYSLLYYFVQADIRYRFPILWISLLPVGWLAARLASPLVTLLSGWMGPRAAGAGNPLRRAG